MSALWGTGRVLRAGAHLCRRGPRLSVIRKAGGGPHIVAQYRQPPQITKHQKFRSELLSGFMWFWIMWHFWHDSDAVFGHFPWPNTDAWTNEELGIPPDDE
ncbi:NADH dehydrogenase [ubiquinone] 1 beta subcomplex subunit 2, mitochondrial [Ictalurus punctatus]|uniref:NADH dehydrogenase [ubiquinone] 1 beta subcomplex subunit 2, mitochondrial n=1 Tax=Ictalurus punctatus TaxID=7998 RepID=E3TGE8_ICTPU|nr:NADH dehydrogenase [ubiquinone] 1 beta subcomplex subunit 2, mitochondrial [Ictalurus punctatus]ADO29384.1 mitochondrial NADH dehydrogenase (ubiquinone) 1 beta subcomplex subunit 2 [Ictalurus punctatus]